MKIQAVDLTWENMAVLQSLEKQCFPHDAPVDFNGTWWWIAYDGDTPVAYAGLQHFYGDRAFLCRAGVIASARGQGLQRRLIRARERGARARDHSRLLTYTADHNVVSSNNLIACGYRLYEPAYKWGGPALYWYRDI